MIEDPDRDERMEMPTRHPCPRCGEIPDANCWLCAGCGVEATTYKAWVLAGRPKEKPEDWDAKRDTDPAPPTDR